MGRTRVGAWNWARHQPTNWGTTELAVCLMRGVYSLCEETHCGFMEQRLVTYPVGPEDATAADRLRRADRAGTAAPAWEVFVSSTGYLAINQRYNVPDYAQNTWPAPVSPRPRPLHRR